ncbi:MAG: lipoprotein-releasing ABC transporter permease subunit [Gammaproteobacteria bacterium]|nr:lipoprotein-releasing ABC transporter permease subunit [Gammaproteobacteria bacterium]
MFRPVSVFIGLRYTRAKRRNHFISFISLMSMMGIALGVIVLITVLSVMNGFDREIKNRVFSMVPPITVGSVANYILNWQDLEKILRDVPDVTAVAPFVSGQVLLTSSGLVQPAMISGIIPDQEKKISEISDKMVQGKLSDLVSGDFGIVLGEDLANRLDVILGDKVNVITPQFSLTPAGVNPRAKRFTVTGIFKAGSGFGFDNMLAYINLTDAQKLFAMGESVSAMHVDIKDVYMAPQFTEKLSHQLTSTARVTNWTEQFGAFFHAVKLEKTMMFFILLLIIAVAVFNLVCTLVMVVNEKEADIAILRTIGATPRTIMTIFIVQGAMIGVVGTFLGVVLGIALAWNVTDIVNWIQHVFHVQFLSSSVYFVNYLPSELLASDIIQIGLSALILSLLATIYPAWRASRTEPVEALRYE